MATTSRSLADTVQNILDYLQESGLVLYTNSLLIEPNLVSFARHQPSAAFLVEDEHPTIDQYMSWVVTGSYSAVINDASLLQMSYTLEGGTIVGHRLSYVPCPFAVDQELLADGEPIGDVIDAYRDGTHEALMRSPIRFDFDPKHAKPGHPASHFTINGMDCRIACVAPIHPLRFVDFIYRNFYPDMWWTANGPFFEAAHRRHVGTPVITDDDRGGMHITWDVHAKASA